MPLEFGECVLDTEARELKRAGEVVPLSPKGFQLLTLLLERRPRPLPQQELRDALWPETVVGYTSLAAIVAEVRKAIGDSARSPRLIRTVARFGYAFAGEVEIVASLAPRKGAKERGALVSEEHEFPLCEGETLVGRGAECGVRLPSTQVSRVHAKVRIEGSSVTVEDAGSKNGTWVNGERQQGPVGLTDGDEVIFGTFRVLFRKEGASRTRTGRPR